MTPMEKDANAGHRKRLRERFQKSGLEGFGEHEVVELLLTLCVPRQDVKPRAKALLAKFGSLKGILDASADELQEVSDIGSVTPVALRIVKEIAKRYLQETAQTRPLLNSVDALIDVFRVRLSELRHEVFEIAFLDKRYQLMPDGILRLVDGLPDRATVYPRKVLQAAISRHAVSIAVAHNHPSGQLRPSRQDIQLTKNLITAADAVGLTLVDHIIVTPDDALSFRDQNLM